MLVDPRHLAVLEASPEIHRLFRSTQRRNPQVKRIIGARSVLLRDPETRAATTLPDPRDFRYALAQP